jgi:phosphoenolpyruvate-protein kinase (PTS system EI component)
LQAAREANIPVIVCGEMASTPVYAALLLGMGAVDLSMTPAMIPRVREVLSKVDTNHMRRLASTCLGAATADEVEELVNQSVLSA